MLKDIFERIQRRLDVMNLSASAASVKANLSPDAIRNIARAVASGKDEAGASTNTLEKLAPILRTTPSWLLEGKGQEDLDTPEPWGDLLRHALSAAVGSGISDRDILREISRLLDEIERSAPGDMKLVSEVAQRVRGMKDSQGDGDT